MARAPVSEHLVIDIETVPDERRWKPPEAAPEAPAPFPPNWAHRIIVVGYAHLREHALVAAGTLTGFGEDPDQREIAVLGELGALIERERPTLVTFNGRGFDLPVMALRSLCHAMPMAWYYRDRNVRTRYIDEGHIDLCDQLADYGATRTGSLDAIAKLIGLPGKTGVDGSKVDALYRAGDLAAIERYCTSDVAQTALLFLRYRLIQGRLSREQYDANTPALFAMLSPV